ncbi:hypothetical protein M2459_001335 [Parabacteroides sp. PF5-5]|uniref:hypothetical protein n=1 Tax=unclassified Parabacteroides TaxID=2649774 RepID=UPI002476335A|nr:MULTISPECIES: hypothetical protein [unclassified Parabacteroides]MDH6304600.1 hypothetical protein [Parabacteroides sp. PH5-39]MDH6315787.1 hypothetical protein [Parabacteroides sp. PF5-13]MDH6319446.1 hypothetical protein [Parabacteroides sp. PH5-13]MDH6323177.1 hypothetical protein [Parabacteroides sp. PH5-8]MDH6326979.1 hypothetical protein [Parabacteroides sp. PH5-41]
MIVNSKFSSLYLGRKEYWKTPFEQDVCYIQKFAINEEIRIQFKGLSSNFSAKYINYDGIETIVNVELIYIMPGNDSERIYEVVFSINKEGLYIFTLTNGYEEASTELFILKKEELENTVLISYTHRHNEYNTFFYGNNGDRKIFNFRVDGGFYPGDKKQAVDNEMFRDQRYYPHQLSSNAYEISILTIGTKQGVPVWVGNKINHIFNLSDIAIDGVETVRSEASIPTIEHIADYYPLYVFKFDVEQPDEDRIYSSKSYRVFDTTYDNTFN